MGMMVHPRYNSHLCLYICRNMTYWFSCVKLEHSVNIVHGHTLYQVHLTRNALQSYCKLAFACIAIVSFQPTPPHCVHIIVWLHAFTKNEVCVLVCHCSSSFGAAVLWSVLGYAAATPKTVSTCTCIFFDTSLQTRLRVGLKLILLWCSCFVLTLLVSCQSMWTNVSHCPPNQNCMFQPSVVFTPIITCLSRRTCEILLTGCHEVMMCDFHLETVFSWQQSGVEFGAVRKEEAVVAI